MPIYLHPGLPNAAVIDAYYKDYAKDFPQMLRAGWGYTVETATLAIRMVLCGVFDKHPELKIILGHLGETLPFLVWRVDMALARPGAAQQAGFRDMFCKHFYVTTSGFFSNPALLCCVMEMGIDRILFAVDWPFVANPPAVRWMETRPAVRRGQGEDSVRQRQAAAADVAVASSSPTACVASRSGTRAPAAVVSAAVPSTSSAAGMPGPGSRCARPAHWALRRQARSPAARAGG